MIGKKISNRRRRLIQVMSVIGFVAFYSFLSYRQHEYNKYDKTIPNLNQFKEGFVRVIRDDNSYDSHGPLHFIATHIQSLEGIDISKSWIYNDFVATLERLIFGIAGGFLLSLFIGMFMGVSSHVEAFFEWPLNFFANIPPTAMMTVYFVLFGTDDKMLIAIIALGIFPTFAKSIYQTAKKDVGENEIFKAYTLGASWMEVVYDVIFKKIYPRVLETLRLQVGPATIFLIAAEIMCASIGVGYRLRIESRMNMSVVFIYLVFLGTILLLVDIGLKQFRKYSANWYGE